MHCDDIAAVTASPAATMLVISSGKTLGNSAIAADNALPSRTLVVIANLYELRHRNTGFFNTCLIQGLV